MFKLSNIFRKPTRCVRCGKVWPPKEAYYDKRGNAFCSMECVRAQQIDTDEDFLVVKGS